MAATEEEEVSTIVIDNANPIGHGHYRVGFAGSDAPLATFPSMVARPLIAGASMKDYAIGKEAKELIQHGKAQEVLNSMDDGIIQNWDLMEKIWYHSFYNELRALPEEHPVILTEMPLNPKVNRLKTTQLMFEQFNVLGFYLVSQSVLSVYSSGRGSGICVDCGEEATYLVPVFEGYALAHTQLKIPFAGRHLTQFAKKLLEDSSSTASNLDLDVARQVKEKFARVALDYDEEMKAPPPPSNSFELPDGKVLNVGNQMKTCAEALFQPSLVGLEHIGLTQAIVDRVFKCDVELRRDMWGSILLVGGTTHMPGLKERVEKDVAANLSPYIRTKALTYPEASTFAWIGGSILGSLSTFANMMIQKQEYDEVGPNVVERKCW